MPAVFHPGRKAASGAAVDFSQGSVAGNILRLALPMTVAQLINVLYSVVDRMYIGRLPDTAADALTGVGLTFPIITIVTAFAMLAGMGGSPCAPSRGGKGTSTAKRSWAAPSPSCWPWGGAHRPVPGH